MAKIIKKKACFKYFTKMAVVCDTMWQPYLSFIFDERFTQQVNRYGFQLKKFKTIVSVLIVCTLYTTQ